MENNRDDAAAALHALSTDRAQLADRSRPSGLLMAAFGATAAAWVGSAALTSPGEDYQSSPVSFLALGAFLLVGYLVRQRVGIAFGRWGARAQAAMAIGLVLCLILFSVSLGLVAADLTWAVVLTSAVAFAAVTYLATVAYRGALEKLAHG